MGVKVRGAHTFGHPVFFLFFFIHTAVQRHNKIATFKMFYAN